MLTQSREMFRSSQSSVEPALYYVEHVDGEEHREVLYDIPSKLESTSSTSLKMFHTWALTTYDRFSVQKTQAISPLQEYSIYKAKLMFQRSWIKDFIKSTLLLKSVADIAPYYKEIQILLNEKEYHDCDHLIDLIRVNKLSDTLLVGLPRLTYSYRQHLSRWSTFIDDVKNEMAARGLDYDKLLKGINY